MFEGRTLTQIKPIGGLVAGQQKTYELYTQGAVISITNPNHVKAIDQAIREAKKMNIEVKPYLEYMIDEEGILN